MPFHQSSAEVKSLWGPNRGGKTTAGAFELVSYAMGYNLIRDEAYETPNETWAVCIDYQSAAGKIMHQRIREALPKGYEYNKQQHVFTLPNGSRIHVKTQAEGREHFYGGDPLAIWFDEGKAGEMGLEVFNECFIRRSPYHPLHIFMTLTHLNGHDWLYHRVLHSESKEFIPGAEVYKFTIEDTWKENGGFWDKAQTDAFEGVYDEYERQARFYGDATPFGNKPFFSWKHLLAQYAKAQEGRPADCKMHSLARATIEEGPGGRCRLFRPCEQNHSYIASWDPSSGNGQDRSAFVVLDRSDLAEVFHACRADLDPDIYAREIVLPAATYYNLAILSVENNGESGGAAVAAVRDYSNLYLAKNYDKATATFTEKIGWQTTTLTRGKIMDSLTRALREGKWSPSRALLDEMGHVVIKRKDDGRYKAEHADGFHDDLVMAMGIALSIHYQEPIVEWPDFRKLKLRYGPSYTKMEFVG